MISGECYVYEKTACQNLIKFISGNYLQLFKTLSVFTQLFTINTNIFTDIAVIKTHIYRHKSY
jgi:hypothetical protein